MGEFSYKVQSLHRPQLLSFFALSQFNNPKNKVCASIDVGDFISVGEFL